MTHIMKQEIKISKKWTNLESELIRLKNGMTKILLLIQQNPTLAMVKPEVLEKIMK